MRLPESMIYGRWPEDLTTTLDRLDGADLAVAASAAVAVRARQDPGRAASPLTGVLHLIVERRGR